MRHTKSSILWITAVVFIGLFNACSDSTSGVDSNDRDPNENGTKGEIVKPPFDGQSGNPGFFLDSWEPKDAVIPDHRPVEKVQADASVFIYADPDDEITRVSPYLFGNNANTYMTQMIDQPNLMHYISSLSPNVIRFPGGNLSNMYFWNADPGNPPDDAPDQLIDGNSGNAYDAGYWYGNNTQSWTISLDNFYEVLNRTGSTGMFTVNYSYARYGTGPNPLQTAAKLAADWVRYDNGRTRYWEIGNENGGPWQAGYLIDTDQNQDGQPERITGALYGSHFNVFADSMRAAADEIGADIKIGAQLIHFDAANSWNPADRDWNEGYFQSAGNTADYYIVHDYFTEYDEDSTPDAILSSAEPVTHDVMEWMNTTFSRHGATTKPIAFTEWNIFATGSSQMVSDISGMHATMVVGEMMKNSYGMAARWNLANGWEDGNDHGMFNAGDEPGGIPRWHPRPDFFHLYFFQRIFGDTMIFSWEQGLNAPDIHSYASRYSSGHTGMVIANTGGFPRIVEVDLIDADPGERYYWYTITGGEGGDFSRQVEINNIGPEYASGGPLNYEEMEAFSAETDGGIKLRVPGRSVSYLLIE
ncbi:alpha-L-arabinofuranosidase [Rhodohalobacter sp. SW132]|uniref:alpha-L-arabinofuranosidase n=1 Tax=Rhodohalobacter sp. SW132 TaxID=2293433 RepID=UPI0011C03424|nr:alpha-L-arabinofuranosidase [Rhodohalobacter sp. SW132]